MVSSYRDYINGPAGNIVKSLSDFIISRRSDYANAVLFRIVFAMIQDTMTPVMGKVEMFHRSETGFPDAAVYDYGNVILTSYILPIDAFLLILSGVVSTGKIVLQDRLILEISENANSTLLFSKSNYGYGGHDWPSNLLNFSLSRPPSFGTSYQILSRKGLPTYPDLYTAITDFLRLSSKVDHSSNLFQLIMVIPDFRARISEIVISGKRVTLTIDTKTASPDKIVAKMYLAKERRTYQSGDLTFNLSMSVECQADFEPDIITVAILGENDELLDAREIHLGWSHYSSDVKVESPLAEIIELIKRGENENVEFKREEGNDFLETFVAFANANGGRILLGVEKNGQIRGYQVINDLGELHDKITCRILSNIQPSTIKFKLQKVELDGQGLTDTKTVIVISIFKGDNKPYYLRDKGILMRHGATDSWITPTELDEIYTARNSSNSFPAGLRGFQL